MSSAPSPSFSQDLRTGHQLVQLPSGTTLECDVAPPPAPWVETTDVSQSVQAKLAVFLHPWSWLGGCMGDPVLNLLVAPLHRLRYHVIRYNSRGVGKSSGWASLTGSREAQDLRELVQWAIDRLQSVESVVIVGYSYGSLIASLHPLLPHPRVSHIIISYPLSVRHWLTAFHGGTYTAAVTALVRDDRAHVLALYGDHDDFTNPEAYEGWTRSLSEATAEGVLKIVKVEGADHFWRESGARVKLVETIETWLS
ncbi:Alpha/Beta hydrolase protein [Rhodofomes roseus]|uniref:Alpha/Beta hydrolase protein n=1 Tax=Rhodofomes roseus TaxID=34475 RepID=A0ABQ8K3Y8_9APHY|nr:Alpha/Beta hydrolase protein [Rhodofomes roseus]KAH9831594.1 Alpha/Beta hydrolase protein [Rhodofomes roseus]